jgi:hypothetical protein
MSHRIRIIQHEGALGSGSYEVWFPDGRTSQFFYWNDVPHRWLRPGVLDRETARREAKAFAALSCSKKDVPTHDGSGRHAPGLTTTVTRRNG